AGGRSAISSKVRVERNVIDGGAAAPPNAECLPIFTRFPCATNLSHPVETGYIGSLSIAPEQLAHVGTSIKISRSDRIFADDFGFRCARTGARVELRYRRG